MFKLFVLAAVLAVVAAKPGLIGAPLAYTAPAIAYSAASPYAYKTAAYAAAPIAYSGYSPYAYSAGYAAAPYAYSAGYVSPYAYNSYIH